MSIGFKMTDNKHKIVRVTYYSLILKLTSHCQPCLSSIVFLHAFVNTMAKGEFITPTTPINLFYSHRKDDKL